MYLYIQYVFASYIFQFQPLTQTGDNVQGLEAEADWVYCWRVGPGCSLLTSAGHRQGGGERGGERGPGADQQRRRGHRHRGVRHQRGRGARTQRHHRS